MKIFSALLALAIIFSSCDTINEWKLNGTTYYAILEYDNNYFESGDPIRIDSTMKSRNKWEFHDNKLITFGFLHEKEYPFEIKDKKIIFEVNGRKDHYYIGDIDETITLTTSDPLLKSHRWVLVRDDAWENIPLKIFIWRNIYEKEPFYDRRYSGM